MSNHGIEKSFRKTVTTSELPSLIEQFGELTIDSMLDEGLLKEVPIFSTMRAIGKTVGHIRDVIFTRNMMLFLESLSSMDYAERQRLISMLNDDGNFGRYAGERILDLLDNLDGDKKPILLAVALRFYAEERITSEDLVRLNYALERFLLCDIDALKAFCIDKEDVQKTDGSPEIVNFINSGLAYVGSGYGLGGVHPTETAKLLLQVFDASRFKK